MSTKLIFDWALVGATGSVKGTRGAQPSRTVVKTMTVIFFSMVAFEGGWFAVVDEEAANLSALKNTHPRLGHRWPELGHVPRSWPN